MNKNCDFKESTGEANKFLGGKNGKKLSGGSITVADPIEKL